MEDGLHKAVDRARAGRDEDDDGGGGGGGGGIVPIEVSQALGQLVVVGGRIEQAARTFLFALAGSPDNFAMERVLKTIRRLIKAPFPAGAGQRAGSLSEAVVDWTLDPGPWTRASSCAPATSSYTWGRGEMSTIRTLGRA